MPITRTPRNTSRKAAATAKPRTCPVATAQPMLYVPEAIAAETLPALLRRWSKSPRWITDHQDQVAFVLHKILCLRMADVRLGPEDYSPLHFESLAGFIPRKYIKEIKELLLQNEVIECDKCYIPGVVSKGYRWHARYRGQPSRRVPVSKATFANRLARGQQRCQMPLLQDGFLQRVHQDMLAFRMEAAAARAHNAAATRATESFLDAHHAVLSTRSLSGNVYKVLRAAAADPLVRLPSVKKWKELRAKNPGRTLYELARRSRREAHEENEQVITVFAAGDFDVPLRRGLGSRVYTNLTNLSRDLRPFLVHQYFPHERLVNCDIANSQPFFACLLLREAYQRKAQAMPANVQNYIRLTSTGQFYEYMAELVGVDIDPGRNPFGRKNFKVKLFSQVFFCKDWHTQKSKFGKKFIEHFPDVYRLLQQLKTPNYKNLATTLQRTEAAFMLDCVMTHLQEMGVWCASIHDSIVCLECDQDHVINTLLEAFEREYKLSPKIEPELLRKAESDRVHFQSTTELKQAA
ncbi:hypothetical protein [Hymenobacter jejuensis]|uniref:Uncharacterized protein n=1 Tax=Hymenobacter jejuensis TaxID=2502781 RepID=A0A5B8A5Z5_9BACT|nr:hypothetical protein [Hymenobacter jejuensis]QDA61662.1 hypothetical protein FHG12_16855 [Hymenobacter jejuensis]